MGRILTLRELAQRVRPGLNEKVSRTYFWRLVRANQMPAPLRISHNRIGWREEEIEAWLASRPRARYTSPKPRRRAPAQERTGTD